MSNRTVCMILPSALLVALAGCAVENPSTSISDPAVYTSTHIAAVPAALSVNGRENGRPSMNALPFKTVTDELMRYFRQESGESNPGESDSGTPKPARYLRMDKMLDQNQRNSSLAQLLASRLATDLTIRLGSSGLSPAGGQPGQSQAPSGGNPEGENPGGGGAPKAKDTPPSQASTPDSKEPAKGESKDGRAGREVLALPTLSSSDVSALEDALSAVTEDSPFDRLDRATDFYTAYLLKLLPGVGRDTRLLDSNTLASAASLGQQLDGLPGRISKVEFERINKNRDELRIRLAAARTSGTAATAEVQKIQASLLEATRQKEAAQSAMARLKTTLDRVSEATRKEAVTAKISNPSDSVKADSRVAAVQSEVDATIQLVATQDAEIQKFAKQLAPAKQVETATSTEVETLQKEMDSVERTMNDLVSKASGEAPVTGLTEITDEQSVDRLLLLTFQTHVHPGTRANTMTGVRVRIVGATMIKDSEPESRWREKSGPELAKVIRLHPTRSYDVESQAFIELATQVLQTTTSATLPISKVGEASGSVESDSLEETRERRRFLSRLTKTASFADASNHEFGWNFYPTNLSVQKRSGIQRLGDALSFQQSGRFEIDAYLEGGARDCAVWLIVPKHLESIDLLVDHVVASVDPTSMNRRESRWYWDDNGARHRIQGERSIDGEKRTIRVTLPTWNKKEATAYFRVDELSKGNAPPK